MKENTDIFSEEIELPNIVSKKMEEAFAIIQKEENMAKISKSNFNSKKIGLFRYTTVAAVCICMLIICGTTAYAAYKYFWSRGMQGTLQPTEIQQQTLVEKEIATVFQETGNYSDMAVTDGGITVTPEIMVVNDNMVYLSLSVDGYSLTEGYEPCFEFVDVYLGDDPQAEDGWLNMGASFYDGIISAEDGTNMYDDGTPLIIDKNGRLESHYVDENGRMEFIIIAMVNTTQNNLLGKTLNVNLKNLGTVHKTDFADDIEGSWEYSFKLSNTSSMEVINVEKEIEDTIFLLDSVEISPVAIKLNYDIAGNKEINKSDIFIPWFSGIVYKDGSRISYLASDGTGGFTDDSLVKAYNISAFDRVIEPEQVVGILLMTENGIQVVDIR